MNSTLIDISGFKNRVEQDLKQISTWDSSIDVYANKISRYKRILKQQEFENTTEKQTLIKDLNSLLKKCTDSEFQIALVGTIKAGKSTLMNAILGMNIASTRVTPETAVLTKFKSSSTEYIRVKFYTSDEWNTLWKSISNRADVFKQEYKSLNGDMYKNQWINHEEYIVGIKNSNFKDELERWSSSKHPEHYFVKEIEVGLKSLNLPSNVVFVDTPGLDDPVAYRSKVTEDYIKRANAVFVCVTAHALTGSEIKKITEVFDNSNSKEKIFIIGTQTDALNNPIQDWKEQKKEWVKYLGVTTCFGNEQLADSNILATAGYLENLCREYKSLNDDDIWTLESIAMKYRIRLNDVTINELRNQSNIDNLKNIIQINILSKYRDILIKDIEIDYKNISKKLIGYFQEKNQHNKELLLSSNENLENIKKRVEQATQELQETNELASSMKDATSNFSNDFNIRMNNLKSIIL